VPVVVLVPLPGQVPGRVLQLGQEAVGRARDRAAAAVAAVPADPVDGDRPQPRPQRPLPPPIEPTDLPVDDEQDILRQVAGLVVQPRDPGQPAVDERLVEVVEPPPVVLGRLVPEAFEEAEGGRDHAFTPGCRRAGGDDDTARHDPRVRSDFNQ
jgi:hypothetical protein